MRTRDISIALICGLAIGVIANDFLKRYAINIFLVSFVLVVLAVIGLFVCELLGEKILMIRQAGRHVLAGAFADVIDIKVFQALSFLLLSNLALKTISFLIATFVKYWGNKYWSFEKIGEYDTKKETLIFFGITVAGLLIDLAIFYFFSAIVGAHFGFSTSLWTELSIILAAIVAGVWNFLGYKFIVFQI